MNEKDDDDDDDEYLDKKEKKKLENKRKLQRVKPFIFQLPHKLPVALKLEESYENHPKLRDPCPSKFPKFSWVRS